jgi:hypothetical protein
MRCPLATCTAQPLAPQQRHAALCERSQGALTSVLNLGCARTALDEGYTLEPNLRLVAASMECRYYLAAEHKGVVEKWHRHTQARSANR